MLSARAGSRQDVIQQHIVERLLATGGSTSSDQANGCCRNDLSQQVGGAAPQAAAARDRWSGEPGGYSDSAQTGTGGPGGGSTSTAAHRQRGRGGPGGGGDPTAGVGGGGSSGRGLCWRRFCISGGLGGGRWGWRWGVGVGWGWGWGGPGPAVARGGSGRKPGRHQSGPG
jgi:hypothetical protein